MDDTLLTTPINRFIVRFRLNFRVVKLCLSVGLCVCILKLQLIILNTKRVIKTNQNRCEMLGFSFHAIIILDPLLFTRDQLTFTYISTQL